MFTLTAHTDLTVGMVIPDGTIAEVDGKYRPDVTYVRIDGGQWQHATGPVEVRN